MTALLWLLLQAAAPATPARAPATPAAAAPARATVDPIAAGTAALKGVVVDAIRNCGTATDGTILVCSRDRGFAERQRVPKLEKPKVPDTAAIKVELSGGPAPRPEFE